MRIAFLSGSLEPGKDGVGDYTRLLAGACEARGVSCRLISLADFHVDRMVSDKASSIGVVRLPHRMPWSQRRGELGRQLAAFAPSWVSLQFVPYSFERRGMAVRLARDLPAVVAPARLHVMLHETWTDGAGSWRARLVSAVQRRCVLRLCRPPTAIVHTSNGTYVRQCLREGIPAQKLSLFGSPDIVEDDALEWLAPILAGAGCDAVVRRADWWLCGLFGTLHPVWPAEPLFSRLEGAAAAVGKRIAIVSVGRIGSGEQLWAALRQRYHPRIPMVALGEQPVGRISQVLNTVDFGIATSPYALVGKSATVAAMLEHGLPVIVNREDGFAASADSIEATDSAQIIRMDVIFADRLVRARRRPAERRLPAVANQFLVDLKTAAGC